MLCKCDNRLRSHIVRRLELLTGRATQLCGTTVDPEMWLTLEKRGLRLKRRRHSKNMFGYQTTSAALCARGQLFCAPEATELLVNVSCVIGMSFEGARVGVLPVPAPRGRHKGRCTCMRARRELPAAWDCCAADR